MTSSVPIVYVETNWVVAWVVSHDDAHKSAERLLEQAARGECELRIPQAAILESRGAVANAIRRFYDPFEKVKNAVYKAYGIVWRPDFQLIAGLKVWADTFP